MNGHPVRRDPTCRIERRRRHSGSGLLRPGWCSWCSWCSGSRILHIRFRGLRTARTCIALSGCSTLEGRSGLRPSLGSGSLEGEPVPMRSTRILSSVRSRVLQRQQSQPQRGIAEGSCLTWMKAPTSTSSRASFSPGSRLMCPLETVRSEVGPRPGSLSIHIGQ
jgi:hypothetical protein